MRVKLKLIGQKNTHAAGRRGCRKRGAPYLFTCAGGLYVAGFLSTVVAGGKGVKVDVVVLDLRVERGDL